MGKQIMCALAAGLLAATLGSPAPAAEAAAGGRACQNIAHRGMHADTEQQVRGVARNARWGFTEVDARVTSDGVVVAIHDISLERISGGKSTAHVSDRTFRRIRRLPYKFGRRVETTRRLIREAGRSDSPIMVTANSYARYRQAWDGGGLDALWRAAQQHPNPDDVYFGGAGAERAMREAHPQASTFHRYRRGDDILEHAVEYGVDLVGLPKARFDRGLVADLKREQIRVATVQLARKGSVRKANAAGIRLIQTDRGKRTVRRWCR